MKRVIIESPYKGDIERNVKFARAVMRDSIMWGEAPFMSHLLYTQVLKDAVPDERNLGIKMGLAWGRVADRMVVYDNLGITEGMQLSIDRAKMMGLDIDIRTLQDY